MKSNKEKVLEIFPGDKAVIRSKDIIDKTGMNQATVQNLLRELERRNEIEKVEHGRYRKTGYKPVLKETDTVMIPFHKSGAEGGDGFEFYEDETEYIEIGRAFIKMLTGMNPNLLRAIRCGGDSMKGKIDNRFPVLYMPMPSIEGDGIYVLKRDNLLIIKIVQLLGGNTVRLSSYNPQYPDTVYFPTETDNVYETQVEGRSVYTELMVLGKVAVNFELLI